MIVTLTNASAVQPFIDDVYLNVAVCTQDIPRGGFSTSQTLSSPTSIVVMPQSMDITSWASVFVDGFRMINHTFDFGATWSAYTVSGNTIVFNQPVTGKIDVFYDLPWLYTLPDVNYIKVRNVQGARTKALNPGDLYAGTFCEPLIMAQPHHGYVRLTDDHHELVYVPESNFSGYDAFSFTVLTDRGQPAAPKCVYVKVG